MRAGATARTHGQAAGPRGLAGVLKAVADRCAAAAGLALLSPLLLLIAIVLKLDSRGPVFFRQARAGRNGVPFRVFKFRTMIEGAERIGRGVNIASDDDRITRVGRWLRLTSLDEVPQLINVAVGEMSLIGPRPAPLRHAEVYTPLQRRRLEVRPGLTGWAQVNGRNALSWERRIELDIWYIDHWSPALDLRILLMTPRAMLPGKGLYGVDGVTVDLEALQSSGDQEPSFPEESR